jgi:hypothetical protein
MSGYTVTQRRIPQKGNHRQKTTYAKIWVSSKIQILTTITTFPATQHLLRGYDTETVNNHSIEGSERKLLKSSDQLLCTVLWQQ